MQGFFLCLVDRWGTTVEVLAPTRKSTLRALFLVMNKMRQQSVALIKKGMHKRCIPLNKYRIIHVQQIYSSTFQ